MSGKAIAIVGMRGMGKSTTVKNTIKKVHSSKLLIFDPNREYGDFYNAPLPTFQEFETKMRTVKDMVIVIEEATVFLNNRSFSFEMLDTIVKARHANNTIILVFHSMKKIPGYIYDLLNYVVLLKTQDKLKFIEQLELPQLTKGFLEIKHAELLTNKETGKQYSPQKMIDLFEVTETDSDDDDDNNDD